MKTVDEIKNQIELLEKEVIILEAIERKYKTFEQIKFLKDFNIVHSANNAYIYATVNGKAELEALLACVDLKENYDFEQVKNFSKFLISEKSISKGYKEYEIKVIIDRYVTLLDENGKIIKNLKIKKVELVVNVKNFYIQKRFYWYYNGELCVKHIMENSLSYENIFDPNCKCKYYYAANREQEKTMSEILFKKD